MSITVNKVKNWRHNDVKFVEKDKEISMKTKIY